MEATETTALGQHLQARRRQIGLSMKKLAQEVGVCEKTIHNWENDECCFPVDRLMPMCRALYWTPSQLLGSASDLPTSSWPNPHSACGPAAAPLPASCLGAAARAEVRLGPAMIKPMRLGFYGRSAHTTVAFEADAHTKAICGLSVDAPNEQAWQRWYNRIHTDDHARINLELARLNDPRDGVFNMQYRLLGLDGVDRCVIDYGCMIFDSAGEPVRLRGMMLDITDEPRTKMTDDRVSAIVAAISRDHVSAWAAGAGHADASSA